MKKLCFIAFSICICSASLLALNSCDLLSAKKEKEEKAKIKQMEIDYHRKIAERDRKWLKEHESTARRFAESFTRNKGYTIQSITLEQNTVSDVSSSLVELDKPIPTEIQSAYYNYSIVTGDITDNGGLIHISVKVKYAKYESPNWSIFYFQAFRN